MKKVLKYTRRENLTTFFLNNTTLCYNKTLERNIKRKRLVFSFPKKSDLEIVKNYRGITFTTKVYNAVFLNYIQPEENLWKKLNNFQRNQSTMPQSVESSNEYVQNISTQRYRSLISPWRSIPYREERWSKYYLHMVSSMKMLPL